MPSHTSLGRLARAPGRVNLIGDHTDYNEGLALPMAIDLGVEVEFRASDGGGVSIESTLEPGREVLLTRPDPNLPSWARLAVAVVGQAEPTTGGHAVVRGDLPVGMGLSSSAAFSVALTLALGTAPDPLDVARRCQRAEAAIGVPVGLMDPLVSMAATPGTALLIDFSTLSCEPVRIPEDAVFSIVDSGADRTLAGSQYAQRRAECEAAAAQLGVPLGRATTAAAADLIDPVARRRALHVTSEVARVRAFVDALSSGDLSGAGRLMIESHRSLRDAFEVSTPRLDELTELVNGVPGVFGARMTGAGFGGCIVVLSRPGTELAGIARARRVRPSGGAQVRAC